MKLKAHQKVSLDVAKQRALNCLAIVDAPLPASAVADAIWPEHNMKVQGAGAAASRVLKVLEKEKKVKWKSNDNGWGWVKV